MADVPEVAKAKEKLRALVVPAVDTLAELMDSEHDGIRLGASKEVLDRGGVPAKREQHVQIEVGLDQEIAELISDIKRQGMNVKAAQDYLSDDGIEDAEVVVEDPELTPGEQAAQYIGVATDDIPVEAEVVNEPQSAWWQALPPDDETC